MLGIRKIRGKGIRKIHTNELYLESKVLEMMDVIKKATGLSRNVILELAMLELKKSNLLFLPNRARSKDQKRVRFFVSAGCIDFMNSIRSDFLCSQVGFIDTAVKRLLKMRNIAYIRQQGMKLQKMLQDGYQPFCDRDLILAA